MRVPYVSRLERDLREEASAVQSDQSRPPARTVLEQLIRHERGETFEEFVEFAEQFARRNKLAGTISLRHLKRLAAGRKTDGSPLGPTRPATARLLERIFDLEIAELLSSPTTDPGDRSEIELRQRLSASRQVDATVVDLLRQQLNALRRLDRQMGAVVAYEEVTAKAAQVERLQSYSLFPDMRASLAMVLSELRALAGWEALDRYAIAQAWEHHERAKQAAREARSSALLAHATAQQAFILVDLGETQSAVEQLGEARSMVKRTAPTLLRSWLAAAHGEGLAAAGQRDSALRAFDAARGLLPSDPVDPALPFVFLEGVHLDRWRGHALARLGDPEAVDVLTNALGRLDPTFTRAETTLHVDLATALASIGEKDAAAAHTARAEVLAADIGSTRQRHRMRSFAAH
jgi:tetratricopeptide (TPR) repeat protein